MTQFSRSQLLEKLNTLLSAQFEMLVFDFMPPELIRENATQAEKAIDLIRYAENSNRLPQLVATVQSITLSTTDFDVRPHNTEKSAQAAIWLDDSMHEPQSQPAPAPTTSKITWLHLSDWHQPEKDDYDRTVLKKQLIRDIENRAQIDARLAKIDFIVFSGDLTFSGKNPEFELAYKNLLAPILKATKVAKNRLFIVPGNHDLSRDEFEYLPADLAKSIDKHGDDVKLLIQKWLCNERYQEKLLEPFANYQNFMRDQLNISLSAYAATTTYTIADKKITLLGLNSALMCGRKNSADKIDDEGVIFIGEPQIDTALAQIKTADIVMSVMHHPFNWLHKTDKSRVEQLVKSESHFILHGHEHEPSLSQVRDIAGTYILIPAGACYESRDHYNSYNYVHYDLNNQCGQIFFRCWSDKRRQWKRDDELTDTDNGIFNFSMPVSK